MLKDNIKAARKAAGKTQKEVALALGITESTYCGYETGKRQPDATKISKIAAILDVSGNYLLDLPEITEEVNPSNSEEQLLAFFRSLNDEGKNLALANARMLANMPEYKK